MTRQCLIVLIAAACAQSALGGEQKTFLTKNRHYQIFTDLDRGAAMQIGRHMERVYAEYHRRLSAFHTRDSRPMPLFVFSKKRDYLRFFLERAGVDAANTSGLFYAGEDGTSGLATWVEGQSRARVFEILQHEGFHQFAYVRIGYRLPPWANEGLAEYFEDALLVKGRFQTGRVNPDRLRQVVEVIRADKSIPFRLLLNMSTRDWGGSVLSGDADTSLRYNQSWSIVHFLINAQRGKYAKAFEQYLLGVSKGFDSATAFEKAFRTKDYAPFERAWKKYMLALKPDPLNTAVKRLQFLIMGLKELHNRGIEVDSIAALKQKLTEARFRVIFKSHAGAKIVTAADEEYFQPPDSGNPKKPATLELVASKNKKLPPEIVIKGLRPGLRVKWKRNKNGELVDEIVFK